MKENRRIIYEKHSEPRKISRLALGLEYLMGGEENFPCKKYIGNEPFMLTYGNRISDIDI